MNTSVVNVKVNPQVKKEAQAVAEDLGLTLSTLINGYLKQLIRNKTVVFSSLEEAPTDYLLESLRESREDIKANRVSPTFSNADDAVDWLNNSKKKYESQV
ncbi:hypothetical protein A3B51_01345 [Candidatus Curtissbacteria bacterium RIFCSPLOWO2_01_FULL_41_18]|uniref:Damage-inducible protein J n=2 Tax=Candidatus Curtissiibacteriota TaxID=1752717 RepID=A0A1F5FZA2_9BACT|nr:MAG: hypothetical protein A2696_00410 [Candidatus Curtissbacteria bacterium RIFCSPHIGHO2_01_FULL_41_13]OGE03632.1 MAG: hypothetical protein A3B51_01345 [Candidatus Curtissbacteria bacterium RIFCSPLOWO2_01_FULL_41_18]